MADPPWLLGLVNRGAFFFLQRRLQFFACERYLVTGVASAVSLNQNGVGQTLLGAENGHGGKTYDLAADTTLRGAERRHLIAETGHEFQVVHVGGALVGNLDRVGRAFPDLNWIRIVRHFERHTRHPLP